MNRLRYFRIVAATVSTVMIAFFVLDGGSHIPASWLSAFLSLQVGPSTVRILTTLTLTSLGLFFVFIITVLFGRVYCSFLCPLGAVQDVVIWFRKRKVRHRQYPYRPAPYLLHYALSAIVIAAAAGGSLVLLDVLEPYSNFARIVANGFRPLMIGANNLAARLTGNMGYGVFDGIPFLGFTAWSMGFASLSLIVLTVLSWRSGRLFCNSLCPVGAMLSVLARVSVYRIEIKGGECIDCGLCTRVCRARCIDSTAKTVDVAACVGCFDCVGTCPTSGMVVSRFRSKSVSEPAFDTGRRSVLDSSAKIVAGMVMAGWVEGSGASPKRPTTRPPVVPPGGKGIEHFSERCTACHLCIAACPAHVIAPSLLDYGPAGIFQPRMDYAAGYCTYDCVTCTEICPTGALLPISIEEKKRTQLGRVVFVKEDCIVETKKTDCGACAEHCPTKAVKMVPFGKLFIPEVDNEYCVGCGACEHACPTKPRRAIYVDPSPIHGLARQRAVERTTPHQETPVEFPF